MTPPTVPMTDRVTDRDLREFWTHAAPPDHPARNVILGLLDRIAALEADDRTKEERIKSLTMALEILSEPNIETALAITDRYAKEYVALEATIASKDEEIAQLRAEGTDRERER